MPIKIPDNLPARRVLEQERVPVITEADAIRQDIRPMRIALLNLMPDKIRTETQIARLVGATPLQVEMTLLKTASYEPKNTPEQHMLDFYRTWYDIRDEKFDGIIVTGAPIETLEFEEVLYWDELTAIFDWIETNVYTAFYICWGAQAALHHHHGVPKHGLPEKKFGVFQHYVTRPHTPLLRGFSDDFSIPVSRHTEVRSSDIPDVAGLHILAESPQSGLCLVEDETRRAVYMFNHLEYDAMTLRDEYRRDLEAKEPINIPCNYFPDDDPERPPINHWRAYAHLLFGNWIGAMYNGTPYNIDEIGEDVVPLGQTKIGE